ncbi:AraC-type DNA-binding protein [Tenacibaculum sp. MAR_2009_124]|uniref:helix-turn-helix domain-containing protein n=1 Tax=Tenacibaculum sp. MAR_2009_124 TaxID=1250059 RepID=UPI00089CF742|nr:AraC family transcriptional regulator [Tenacibaculum sp. MAR_2009_124]SEC53786.1 AraC-type DNA-binding protein [Tenacibaculum sp. MAR_2009_124]
MTTISLPKELNIESSEVSLYNYKSTQEISKQQIQLTQNTFSFLIEGNKEVISSNNTVSIDNSSFLLMNSGYCLMTEKLSNTQKKYQSILLFFSDDVILNFIRKYDLKNIKNNDQKLIHSFQKDLFLKNYIQGLQYTLTLPSKTQQHLTILKFEELMLYLVETYGTSFLSSIIKNGNHKSNDFLNTVETNKHKKLTLAELAFLSNMSISTFKREFEKHFQESPIKWFQEKRFEYAAFLLKNEQKRASEIYHEIGYESLSSFVQAFKIRFGQTPKQFQSN